ncbi:MAG: hypothetical protein HDS66_08550 [Bacteroidales bacterium]|nr:hypothetical protein [Bacteroidales bacterium]
MNELRGLWRGKSEIGGQWIVGYLRKAIYTSDDVRYSITDTMGAHFIVDPSTLGECIGLRDNNGKLIFEGDILDFPDYSEQDVVEWDDEYSGFYFTDTDYSFTGVASVCEAKNGVVIGNIHDNPELLKGADENAEKD